MSLSNPIDIIALFGGLLLSICLVPQIYITYKTKDVSSISIHWQILYILGLTSTDIYAFYYTLLPILIPGTLELLLIIILTGMKLYYNNHENTIKNHKKKNILLTISSI